MFLTFYILNISVCFTPYVKESTHHASLSIILGNGWLNMLPPFHSFLDKKSTVALRPAENLIACIYYNAPYDAPHVKNERGHVACLWLPCCASFPEKPEVDLSVCSERGLLACSNSSS
ncbi:hypothetical protein PsorP6_001467 [Peronosclerospora sorghi]|uniref:Uncharacterized protein n=1 Tax=Peronosclerospora sorghi TaxID=230839 RepID=A0ACC0WWE5_9STRA|nr:hypothetical protein PsorP6_001467 [Peronosclerospora sorghi]